MPNYIIYHQHGRDSVAALASGLNVIVARWLRGHWVRQIQPANANIVIGWATQKEVECNIRYNKPAGVAVAANKRRCRVSLNEAGVPVPRMTDSSFPCIGRPDHHYAGQNFFVCNDAQEVTAARVQGATYFSEVYPKTREFRVHIGSGMVLFVCEKIAPAGFRGIIWNHNLSGFSFQLVGYESWPAEVVFAARAAVEVAGLDYAAVDIMANPDHNPPAVVAEINTGMRLSAQYNIGVYTRYFNWLLSGTEYRAHLMGDKRRSRSLSFTRFISRMEGATE